MATLTKGMSYRRQGSSGMIWADNMLVTEDGVFPMGRQQNDGRFLRTPVRVTEATDLPSGAAMIGRSKSVGSSTSASATATAAATPTATSAAPTPRHKSSFRVVRWLKKAITKIRR